MSIIALLGGHGIGKTTAIKRWAERYGKLCVPYDLDGIGGPKDNANRIKLVQEVQDSPFVGVLATAKGYSAWCKALKPTDPVILVTVGPELGRQWMERRKGGPLTDWWGDKQLGYELHEKFLNYSSKNLCSDQVSHFHFTDQEQDWAKVDERFGELYRPIHNLLIKHT